MTWNKLRRACGTVALTAAISLLAAGPAQAARSESAPAPAAGVATRSLLQEVWTLFSGFWEAVSSTWDAGG